jgi:hypothetical protein
MKSYSNVRPPIFHNLGDGSWYYNFNIKEVPAQEESENEIAFEYETVLIWGTPEYVKTLTAVINEFYSKDDEIALINKGIEDKTDSEYMDYREWVSNIKEMVKQDLQEF